MHQRRPDLVHEPRETHDRGPGRPGDAAQARRFLVLEPDVLVAGDLAETIASLDPAAVVIAVRDAEGAMAALAEVPSLTAGFLRMPSEELAQGTVPGAVEARGGRVVVMDGAGPAAREGWLHTGRPYGARVLLDVLRRLGLTQAA